MKLTQEDPNSVARHARPGFVCGVLLLLGCLSVGQSASAQPASSDSGALRERIALERRQADARLESRRWECSHRFAVTICMNEAKAEHRQAFERLGREEEALDSQLRHARATKRLEIIRQKIEAQARLSAASAAQPSEGNKNPAAKLPAYPPIPPARASSAPKEGSTPGSPR